MCASASECDVCVVSVRDVLCAFVGYFILRLGELKGVSLGVSSTSTPVFFCFTVFFL